ncbi:hypothetical protein B0H10DRAFT_1990509 [Mycena sp. CBHHK59/15]|nr:hypothetical protein B0H10DRAFT_1990509 [Mycena sp. CBHHK59/15]
MNPFSYLPRANRLLGIYFILFPRCAYVLCNRSRKLHRQGIFLAAVIILFTLSTAQLFTLSLKSAIVVGESKMEIDQVLTASLPIYVTSCICADALLIYRCYASWDDNFYVIIVPLILVINSAAFGYTRNLRMFQITSLTSIISVTLLTVSRIAWAAFQRRWRLTRELRQTYLSATSTILESGAIHAFIVSIHFAFFSRGSPVAPGCTHAVYYPHRRMISAE